MHPLANRLSQPLVALLPHASLLACPGCSVGQRPSVCSGSLSDCSGSLSDCSDCHGHICWAIPQGLLSPAAPVGES